MVFRPYKVPCGPRSTVTSSTSYKSVTAPTLRAIYTPFTSTPTAGSKVDSTSMNPRPRIANAALNGNAPTGDRLTFGILPSRSETADTFKFSNAAALYADTAIGQP